MLLFSRSYKAISSAPMLHQSVSKLALHLAEHHLIQTKVLDKTFQPRKEEIEAAMISAKRLVQMEKKWQSMSAFPRKRLIRSTPMKETEGSLCSTSSLTCKGHCVVYSVDGRRFEVPLAYLGTTVFGELLRMSQEEFGFASENGKITLPCDAVMMEYVMCMLRREASEEVERAFMSSIARPCHYGNGMPQTMGLLQQVAVSSF